MPPKKDDPVLVYSTEQGRVCPDCRRPVRHCACRRDPAPPKGDGIVRVRRETKGRGGKTVTTAEGIPLAGEPLRRLCTDLKTRCGSGGTVKDGVIQIQGDHREAVIGELTRRGYAVKAAGG